MRVLLYPVRTTPISPGPATPLLHSRPSRDVGEYPRALTQLVRRSSDGLAEALDLGGLLMESLRELGDETPLVDLVSESRSGAYDRMEDALVGVLRKVAAVIIWEGGDVTLSEARRAAREAVESCLDMADNRLRFGEV